MNSAALDTQINVVQSFQAAKLHQYRVHFEELSTGILIGNRANKADGIIHHFSITTTSGFSFTNDSLVEALSKANDTVLQVVNHQQNHEAKNTQAPVRDAIEPE